MACQASLHPHMGIVAIPRRRKTVGLEVELKLNHSSSCEESNEAAGLVIGGAGGCVAVQRAGTRSRNVGEWILSVFLFASFHNTQLITQSRLDCPGRCRL